MNIQKVGRKAKRPQKKKRIPILIERDFESHDHAAKRLTARAEIIYPETVSGRFLGK